MKIGCHVSIAGGAFNAPINAADLGCEVFQMFTRSPQGGPAPMLSAEILKKFSAAVKNNHQSSWVVHTPYYINFASTNPRIKHSSITVVREELERASKLGATFLMTHLGSGKDVSHETAQRMVVEGLTAMLDGYTGSTVFCIEIAAGAGDILGSSFEEIGEYISAVEKKDKQLPGTIGVCFDTCHAFASGYDLRDAMTVKKTMDEFDKYIGFDRLKIVHANDSKFGLGEKKDRHEHIGQGQIGLAGFAAMAKHPALKVVNWYLETEPGGVKQDLATLKKLRS
ncbi:MAG: deoxyribonuclease IV [Patescibacteria group bacterium]